MPSACLATSRHHNRGGPTARSLGEDPSSPVEGRLSPSKHDRLEKVRAVQRAGRVLSDYLLVGTGAA